MYTSRLALRWWSIVGGATLFATALLCVVLTRGVGSTGVRAEEALRAVVSDDHFVTPYPIPVGETEVLIGSLRTLPDDMTVVVTTAGVLSLEAVPLSRRAISVRLSVAAGVSEVAFRLESAGRSEELRVPVGSRLEKQIEVTSIAEQDLASGVVRTVRPFLVYGFRKLEADELAFVRIYNESTDEWYQRIYEPRRPRSSQVDSDGNGIPDSDDVDYRAVHDDFVGVRLAPGPNRLRIACFRRDGRSSMQELVVSSDM